MAALTAPVPSMAIALQEAPASRAPAMSARSSTKKDLHAAGRRRLEQYKKNKREKATKQSTEFVAEEQAAVIEPVDSNGDVYGSSYLPSQDHLSHGMSNAQTDHQYIPDDVPVNIVNSNVTDTTDLSSANTDAAIDHVSQHASIEPRLHSTIDHLPQAATFLPDLESNEDLGLEHIPKNYPEKELLPSTSSSDSGQPAKHLFSSRDFTPAKQPPPPPSGALFRHVRAAVPEGTNGDMAMKANLATSFGMDEPRQRLPARLANDEPLLSFSRKDDFAALEQHIEDLTQEKFSLQRGLDKAKALVESLTQANSALTEDYNQQGVKVNELKAELARYELEFRSQEFVIKNLKAERNRAVQESNAAVGRCQNFAAEVIALEEKVLKTRSQELKSQKEVEALHAEIESCRKQIFSIEKDRQNAITLNEALQEEKQVLLSRIRELADTAKHADVSKSATTEEASTSTDDLVVDIPSTSEPVIAYPTSLPEEQLGIIESINALVTELGEEKETLLRLLRNETSAVFQLKVENAELMQKLESQTQQLELAVAQSMARSTSTVSPISFPQRNEELDYVDEGDEVVDRVLGWIMRLFPGSGSSRRVGSKHL